MKRMVLAGIVAVMASSCVPYLDPNNPAYYDDPDLARARSLPSEYGYDPRVHDPYWAQRQYGFGYSQGWASAGGEHRRKKDRLIIDGAVYQSENGPAVDASHYVRKECQGERDCDVKAKNKIFGDPDVGAHKDLVVTYRCGRRGPTQTMRVPEKREMDIECN